MTEGEQEEKNGDFEKSKRCINEKEAERRRKRVG